MEWDGKNDRRESTDSWHFKKEIQLSHLITTVMILLSAIFYTQKLEQRIAVIESQVQAQRERDARQDADNKELIAHLRAHLDRMEVKIDRLIDYRKPAHRDQ